MADRRDQRVGSSWDLRPIVGRQWGGVDRSRYAELDDLIGTSWPWVWWGVQEKESAGSADKSVRSDGLAAARGGLQVFISLSLGSVLLVIKGMSTCRLTSNYVAIVYYNPLYSILSGDDSFTIQSC